jgi:RimJ/RimL family protein N-acetyltransferase
VAAPFRGQGLGQALLAASTPRAFEALGVRRLVALVKLDNRTSARAFEQSGFCLTGTTSRYDTPCLQFTLDRTAPTPSVTAGPAHADLEALS